MAVVLVPDTAQETQGERSLNDILEPVPLGQRQGLGFRRDPGPCHLPEAVSLEAPG